MNRVSLCAACLAIAASGALAGCEKSTPPAPAPAPTPAAPTPPAPAPVTTQAATPSPVPLEAVPAREDFEEEAQAQITPANLERQLEALEKELAAE